MKNTAICIGLSVVFTLCGIIYYVSNNFAGILYEWEHGKPLASHDIFLLDRKIKVEMEGSDVPLTVNPVGGDRIDIATWQSPNNQLLVTHIVRENDKSQQIYLAGTVFHSKILYDHLNEYPDLSLPPTKFSFQEANELIDKRHFSSGDKRYLKDIIFREIEKNTNESM